jgi:hypothetical protein
VFGFNEKEMQEAEKLADLYDRMRKYARELDIRVVTATAGIQSAPDVTDMTITWDDSQRPKVLDYISLMRTKERPVAVKLRLADNAWDFTMPIGYSPLRDGVRQEFNGKDDTPTKDSWLVLPQGEGEVVESLESLLARQEEIDSITPVEEMSPNPTRKVAVLGGRMTGRTALLLASLGVAAAEGAFAERVEKISGLDADFDGRVDNQGLVRYKTKRPMSFGFGFGGQAADTAVSGAEKRQWSDRKPNGKRKKSWER